MNVLSKIMHKLRTPKRDIHLTRNDLCWCGSGKKYKRCHMATDEALRIRERQMAGLTPRI